jgi:hypothetical protein
MGISIGNTIRSVFVVGSLFINALHREISFIRRLLHETICNKKQIYLFYAKKKHTFQPTVTIHRQNILSNEQQVIHYQ